MKTIKKKQKHKGRGTVRTVTKQVPNDSFFNFFNPIKGENLHTHPRMHTLDSFTAFLSEVKATCVFAAGHIRDREK